MEGFNLQGKNVVITGGYAGMGYHITCALLLAGAKVTVLARSMPKAKEKFQNEKNIEFFSFDLSKKESIKTFTDYYLEKGEPLHLLINYAGLISLPNLTLNEEGLEMQLATNHLGHFRLTTQLWPALQKAGGCRVVTMASRAHRLSPFHFEDPNFVHRPYKAWQAYGQSKTANILFTVHLDKLGQKDNIRSFAVHPGVVLGETPFKIFLTHLLNFLCKISIIFRKWQFKTPKQGAETLLWCATSPFLNNKGGLYCEDCHIATVVADDPTIAYGVREYAIDSQNAKKLWEWSLRVGMSVINR